ncbi:hypothetical protein ABFS83_02G113600 [Erythranthe nasuta]
MAGTKKNTYGDGADWIRGSIIGKGGFGSVYTATLKKNTENKLRFPSVMAVKSSEVSVSTTLQKEMEIMSDLKGSPYLIECFGHEATISSDGAFLAYNLLLEYCSGGTLGERIKKFGDKGLPESEVRVYARCIVGGLCHMHDAGYVHCDIKPDNILLVPQVNNSASFMAKICDFGLAKREVRNFKKRRITRGQNWQGTPMYLSPEAVRDNIQEAPSDIWALGCVVLKMLTGKPVWEGDTAGEIINKIGAEEELLPDIPDYLSNEAMDFIRCCLSRNPSYRFTAQILMDHPFLDGLTEDGDSCGPTARVMIDHPFLDGLSEDDDDEDSGSEDDSFGDSYWFAKAIVDDLSLYSYM